jgi:transposase
VSPIGSVNPTDRRQEAALERRVAGGSLASMRQKGRASHQVTGLIDRIRTLVAERRQLEGRASSDQLEANGREIARLQRRLATVVKRELTPQE